MTPNHPRHRAPRHLTRWALIACFAWTQSGCMAISAAGTVVSTAVSVGTTVVGTAIDAGMAAGGVVKDALSDDD